MVSASVIVCTRNRAGVLGRAVEEALKQARVGDSEVLVVDNASTDETPTVLEAMSRRSGANLRVIRESQLGLSLARNRGLAEAHGEVAAFLDDDAVPRSGWLQSLLAPFAARGVSCTGGRIAIRFPDKPPPWFRPELAGALSGFDLGAQPRRLHYGRPGDYYPYGANIAFRIADARAVGGFSPLVGLRGSRLLAHEETDLCYRIEEAGGEIHYVPEAVVDHLVLAERLTPHWFLKRYSEGGRSGAIFVLRNRGVLRALWRVSWHYRSVVMAWPYKPHEPIEPERLVRECRRREALGYLAGLAEGIWRIRALRRARMTAVGGSRPLPAVAATIDDGQRMVGQS